MKLIDHAKTALIWNDQEISYSELLQHIKTFEGIYSVAPGERVAIFAENRPEWIYSFFSAWGHRAIAVPLDAGLPADEISYIIDDCRPSVIFCSRQTAEVLEKAISGIADYDPLIIGFESAEHAQTNGTHVREEADNEEVAAILYTSGTTGNPKGVMLTYSNLLSCINGISRLKMIRPEDRFLALLPFHHIFPLQGTVIAPLYIGATSILVKSLASEDILATMQKHRPTVFLGVPRLYEMFHRALMLKVNSSIPGRLLFHFCRAVGNVVLSRMVFAGIHRAFGGSVHAYLTGGASLDRKVDQDLRALGFKLVEGYGLTETSPLVAFNPFGAIRPGSVGPVMEGVEVRIISGEVAVRGPNVMKGYYNRPEDTARRLREGWFFTGDKGEFDSKGYLHLKGRTDEMIVLPSGKNIDPEEIEKNILDLTPMISEIGIMQEDGRLIALVHPDFDMLRRENILNFVENIRTMISEKYNATAAGFKRISKVIFVREPLPRTRLGKLKRYLIHGVSERKNMPSHEQAQSFEELSMIKSFIENLTGQNLSQSDHILLDIGLDSLERLQLSLYIEKVFGIRMSESDYMKYTTLLGLSEYIRDNKSRIEKTPSGDGHIFAQKGHERILPGKVLSRMGAFFLPLLRFYHRLKVEGPGNIPEGPCIFAANHQSYLDVFIIIRALPRSFLEKTFFLAKDKKAYHNSLVRFLMTGANMIIIDEKSDIQVTLAKLATVLSSGFCVVIFPEGKRTRNGELGDFKKTFSIISKELGVPVVPVAIDGTYALMPYGSMFPRPGRVRLSFLKPVAPEMSDYQEIAKTVRQSISEVLL